MILKISVHSNKYIISTHLRLIYLATIYCYRCYSTHLRLIYLATIYCYRFLMELLPLDMLKKLLKFSRRKRMETTVFFRWVYYQEGPITLMLSFPLSTHRIQCSVMWNTVPLFISIPAISYLYNSFLWSKTFHTVHL